jgi:hypothetical protein
MDRLADPRRFNAGTSSDLLAQAVAAVVAANDLQRGARRVALREQLLAKLTQGDEAGIRQALGAMPDARHYQILFDALAQVIESPTTDSQPVLIRIFALPLVLVAAAAKTQKIVGSLPDAGAVQHLFASAGVLGPTRNFGLSAALCSFDALDALTPTEIFRAAQNPDSAAIESRLPPAEVAIAPGREQAHLRFIVGAGISPADAPAFSETAANIGAWGMELSKLLGKQLTAPGLQLLVLPRSPKGLMRAPHAGRSAQFDVALNLFISNTVRRFRMLAGDPVATLSTHDDGELRLTLSSVFAQDLVEGFRWPLAALDDLEDLQRQVLQLLAEVRVDDTRVFPAILPAKRSDGANWHPRVDEWESLRVAATRQ